MADCASENCYTTANYICFCDSNIELLCTEHFKIHIDTPMHHSIYHIDKFECPETCNYLFSVLQTNIKALSSIKSTIQGHIKSMKALIKSSETEIDQLNEVQESCESYLNFLAGKMNLPNQKQNKVDLQDYAKSNITAFMYIQTNYMEKIFKEIDDNLQLQTLQKLDLSNYKDFFDIVSKISRPVIEIKNSHMQADPLFYIFEKQKTFNFFDATYKNSDCSLKIYEDTQFYINQLETHKRLSKNNPDFLKVILTFKKKSMLMVLTEKFTHTVLNEVYTRSFDSYFYKLEIILPIFTAVVKIFENESEYKHITPSMLHITPQGNFKIWYPENLEDNSEVLTYLSPEFYAWKTKKENIEYENMNAKSHNLYCIALVFLHIMSLVDTSMMYREENNERLKNLLMSQKESNLRKAILGILIKSLKLRLTYKKVLKILE